MTQRKTPIDVMVDRFLGWQLPDDFRPDGGVSFSRERNNMKPIGTNLLTADQAREMIRHILGAKDEHED